VVIARWTKLVLTRARRSDGNRFFAEVRWKPILRATKQIPVGYVEMQGCCVFVGGGAIYPACRSSSSSTVAMTRVRRMLRQ
jgi:hypothetical protein